jgi:hypothetical protein
VYVTLMESDAVEPSGRAEGDTSPGSDAQKTKRPKKFDTILHFYGSSLRTDHTDLLCIVPILTVMNSEGPIYCKLCLL